jgi:hypothetical protein
MCETARAAGACEHVTKAKAKSNPLPIAKAQNCFGILSLRHSPMNNLEQLAALLFDAIVNLDPQEFDAVTDAVARFKTEDQASYAALMHGGCKEFATLFGTIERAVTDL